MVNKMRAKALFYLSAIDGHNGLVCIIPSGRFPSATDGLATGSCVSYLSVWSYPQARVYHMQPQPQTDTLKKLYTKAKKYDIITM